MKLNQRVNIERHVAGQDAWGQPVDTWELVAARWADVRLLSGLETIKADAPASAVRASIRIRHLAGLDAGMRAVHGTKTYNITAVLEDPARRFVDLACEEVR